jgi:hypothetical protein
MKNKLKSLGRKSLGLKNFENETLAKYAEDTWRPKSGLTFAD